MGRDLAQALNSGLWGLLEAAKAVSGGGPSQEAGVGTRKQTPPSSTHHTSSAQFGQGGGRGPGEGLCFLICPGRLDWVGHAMDRMLLSPSNSYVEILTQR